MKKRNKEKGSFLVEVLLTVSILAFSLTMIIQSLLASLNATVYSSQYSKAIMATENKMFEVFNVKDIDQLNGDEGEFTKPFTNYQYELGVADYDESEYLQDLKRINLTLSWEKSGKTRSLDFETFHFNPLSEK